jgi:Xaa-Pro aminopeptidase
VIEPGDAVVKDFGGLGYGYGADTTRTVCVGGPTSEIREVHDVVRQAQRAGVDAVRPGVSCQEVPDLVRLLLEASVVGHATLGRRL